MVTWNDDEVRMLIDERKADNEYYHSLGGVIAKELGGLQLLAKLINDFVHTLRNSRRTKNFMGL